MHGYELVAPAMPKPVRITSAASAPEVANKFVRAASDTKKLPAGSAVELVTCRDITDPKTATAVMIAKVKECEVVINVQVGKIPAPFVRVIRESKEGVGHA
jgi:hypothetical protein